MERLYQPDFTCIFGNKYGNAFSYGKIDSLIWPIFSDVNQSDQVKKLLNLRDNEGNPQFYIRNVSIEDEKIELSCSDIHLGLIQAMDTGKLYGVSNLDVIEVVKREPTIFKGVLSFDLSQKSPEQDIIEEIERIKRLISVCGIAFYPSLIKLDLSNQNNHQLNTLMEYCLKNSLFVKIDFGNFNIPNKYPQFTTLERIESFVSTFCENTIILSGFNLYGEFEKIAYQFKMYPKLWLEIDPRYIGGLTPTSLFRKLLKTKGFVQNFWERITIGSATPTLEISQMVRGFLDATNELNFAQKNLMRTWSFRNINRLNHYTFNPINELKVDTSLKIKKSYDKDYTNQIVSTYIVQLRSFSITQLLFLTDIVKSILHTTLKKYPNLKDGELFLRSYHTTTTLLINEHEVGNYLDLHYYFSELSVQDSSERMHTVLAKENRPDFNPYDHRIACTYGSKQLIIPIRNQQLELGSRENFYLLAMFGPRTIDVLIEIKLLKEI